jgi:hypothetical protein
MIPSKLTAVSSGEINTAHFGAFGRSPEALANVIECGRLLVLAKAELGHGEFMPWLRKHCEFSARSARRYMSVFRRYHGKGVLPSSLREAIRISR